MRSLYASAVGFDLDAATIDRSFAVFAEQDSGCLSYGVEHGGQRWFVKRGSTGKARASLTRAVAFHASVRHPVIVAPHSVIGAPADPVLVYPWHDGVVLNHATLRGADRAGLVRFQSLPQVSVVAALTDIIKAHVAVAAAGMVAVDLYDGCLLYDFASCRIRLIDLDEYRPGPFVVEEERLPGSSRYMAPEEFVQGEVIDERSTVFTLGRTIWNLLDTPTGWRGTTRHASVVATATDPDRALRFPSVADLAGAWRDANVWLVQDDGV